MKTFARLGLIVSALLLAGCSTGPSGTWSTEVPQGIDPLYSPQGLIRAFAELSKRMGCRPLYVNIDQSDFPFIVYGVFEGRCDYRDMGDMLKTMPGYAYSGS